jgi:two-component system, NarL family, sensor kinase
MGIWFLRKKDIFVFVLGMVFPLMLISSNNQNNDSIQSLIRKERDPDKILELYALWGRRWIQEKNDSLVWLAEKVRVLKHKDANVIADGFLVSNFINNGKFSEAIDLAKKTEKQAEKFGDAKLLFGVRHKRAVAHFKKSELQKAADINAKNLLIADTSDYILGTINALILEGNILLIQGETSKALVAAKKALDFSINFKELNSEATCHKLIGNIYYYQGGYENALASFVKAATIYEQLDLLYEVSSVYNNIASVQRSLKNLEQAESFILRSKQIRLELGRIKDVADDLLNAGLLWIELKPERALYYFDEAERILNESNITTRLPHTYNNIANSYYNSANYLKALEYYQKALQTAIVNKDKIEEIRITNNIGFAFMMLNKKDAAISQFSASLQMAQEAGTQDNVSFAYEGLADVYEHFGMYKEALQFRNMYILAKDSILNEKTAKRIVELQELYESERKERQIDALNQKREIDALTLAKKELELSKARNRNVFLTVFLFLFLLLAYGSYKRLKLKKQRELQLARIQEQKLGMQAVLKAIETERKRIAGDLHDGIAQTLSGIKLALERFKEDLVFQDPFQQEKFKQTIHYLDSACVEVRNISHQMVPKVLLKNGLIPAIRDMLDKSLEHTALNYSFEYFGISEKERLSEIMEVNLYRIAQELINNILKHSGAKKVSFQIIKNEDTLVFVAEDDGIGFKPNDKKSSGLGLRNIKSRVEILNGEINFEPAPQTGIVATVRIPLNNGKD